MHPRPTHQLLENGLMMYQTILKYLLQFMATIFQMLKHIGKKNVELDLIEIKETIEISLAI